MCFLMQQECNCCSKGVKTGDMHHCKDCWNKHHNGERDNDWISKEEYEKTHENLNVMMEKFRKKHIHRLMATPRG